MFVAPRLMVRRDMKLGDGNPLSTRQPTFFPPSTRTCPQEIRIQYLNGGLVELVGNSDAAIDTTLVYVYLRLHSRVCSYVFSSFCNKCAFPLCFLSGTSEQTKGPSNATSSVQSTGGNDGESGAVSNGVERFRREAGFASTSRRER